MKNYDTFFFLLSGELPSKGLPSHEIISILRSNNKEIKKIQLYDQVLLVSSESDICEVVVNRAAYVHRCGKLLFNISSANFKTIEKKIQQLDMDSLLKKSNCFAVRIKKIKTSFPDTLEEELERKIGDLIKKGVTKNIKVNLSDPDILFRGIFTGKNFIFGVSLGDVERSKIRQRAPHTRPFFHPCGLDPLLARAMINLSEINGSKVLYDPFCGSGSVLMEAALMGFKTIGSDISQKMLRGALLNLKSINIKDFYLFRSDARSPCINNINKINCLVTDPPYGRSTRIELGKNNTFKMSSSVYNENLEKLLTDFFRNNVDILEKKGSCVIALPSNFKIDSISSQFNFKIQIEFDIYVHRSLTRNIVILKKV